MSKPEHLEIERRWLLSNIPFPGRGTTNFVYLHLMSIYLLIEPAIEVRLRRVNHFEMDVADTFCLETKLGYGLARQETPKLVADAELFNYYLERERFPRLEKDHWEYLYSSGLNLEINLFLMPTDIRGLVLAEIEFKSEEDARKFGLNNFPAKFRLFIKKEVTEDPRYNSKNLAMNGRPDPE